MLSPPFVFICPPLAAEAALLADFFPSSSQFRDSQLAPTGLQPAAHKNSLPEKREREDELPAAPSSGLVTHPETTK